MAANVAHLENFNVGLGKESLVKKVQGVTPSLVEWLEQNAGVQRAITLKELKMYKVRHDVQQ